LPPGCGGNQQLSASKISANLAALLGLTYVSTHLRRCLARSVKPADSRILFKRGMNWSFPSLRDEVVRPLDLSIMAPASCDHD
jgi:hypothetical protein